jgi:predicted membrane-bound spermidine synthase
MKASLDATEIVLENTEGRIAFAPVAGVLASRPPLVLLGAVFYLSGVPALVYQTTWQRILALHSGVGIYSVAMIVASFMAGLGIGSYLGGVWSRRLNPPAALRAFAVIEVAIGVYGALSTFLYYDVLYLSAMWLFATQWRAGVGHFSVLIIPTCLMGMSLPLLVKATVRDVPSAGRTIGVLYGLNVLGAAIGSLMGPWVLMRFWGIRAAVFIGVGCNVIAGLTAWLVSRGCRTAGADSDDAPATSVERRPTADSSNPFAMWIALYALCGFNGLALEMVWFRLCDVAAKSTAFTFGTVLAVYLSGFALGSLLGVWLLPRMARPLRVFLGCQCLILLYAIAIVILLVAAPSDVRGVQSLLNYWGGYDGVVPGRGTTWPLVFYYGVFPFVLFGFPTALMGVSFCALQRAVQDDRQTSGFKVGVLQAANIAGCVAGSLCAGLVLLSHVGTTGTLRVVAATGVALAFMGVRRCGWRSEFVPLGAALAASIAFVPSQDELWLRLHGVAEDSSPWTMVDEDATGVVAITREPQGNLRVSVDGKGHSWLPYGSIHSYLGALPAVVHPSPRDVAIIGLGSGDTAWAAACRPETERVTVFELCAPQRRLLGRVSASGQFPQLTRLLNDPRVTIEIADGRNALARSATEYDVIEADASRPETAYSGNLYSIEFFQLCASRLRRGGVMCTWSPTRRVYGTFCEVFPHVLDFNFGELLVGSMDAIETDRAAWDARLQSSETASYLGWSIADGLTDYLKTSRPPNPQRAGQLRPNRDLFPRDELISNP